MSPNLEIMRLIIIDRNAHNVHIVFIPLLNKTWLMLVYVPCIRQHGIDHTPSRIVHICRPHSLRGRSLLRICGDGSHEPQIVSSHAAAHIRFASILSLSWHPCSRSPPISRSSSPVGPLKWDNESRNMSLYRRFFQWRTVLICLQTKCILIRRYFNVYKNVLE